MAKEFKLYTAINQDAIYQITMDILKNGSVTKGYVLETYDLIDQNALEGSIEHNLEDNDLPTVEELSEEQYGVIYSSLENNLDYARILNVEFGETDAWGMTLKHWLSLH